MKNIVFLLISVFIINELALCQTDLSLNDYDSEKKSDSSFNTLKTDFESNDLGHWIGIRFGTQTKPSNLKDTWRFYEWWALTTLYEYRFNKTFSLFTEFNLFNKKYYKNQTEAYLEPGVKLRLHLLNQLRLSTDVGIALGRINPSGIDFPIGIGIELDISEFVIICMNAKTFIVPDYGYWLSTGINYKIFDN
ncbi:MAG: hypothetical protein BroJett005_08460 [Ignavibacteriota bacterium]|nr:MAG: hypothetical protein BroJett005_08460 [Ignavibacteriota bacterium]